MLRYPDNSNTDLIEDPALSPVPSDAGNNLTVADLYL
jgi:hypothetical protein